MEWSQIHWYHFRLGLQATASTPVYAQICGKGFNAIPAHSEEETASTISKRQNNIQCKEAICNAKTNLTTIGQKREKVHSTGMWKVFIFRKSSGQHPVVPHQRDCITICEPNRGHNETYNAILDYVATQEEAVLTYHASDMKLAAHSDASYLSEPKARSRAGGH